MSEIRGGGVFQAIKTDLLASLKQDLDSDCECIWTQCQLAGRRSLVFGKYYNPDGSVSSLEKLEESLLKIGRKIDSHDVILAGDFNIPHINWSINQNSGLDPPANKLVDLQNEFCFKQMVHEPTRRQDNTAKILDLVFTNNNSLIKYLKVVPRISDHEMVALDVLLKCERKKIPKRLLAKESQHRQGEG